jgi:hypothetical protein
MELTLGVTWGNFDFIVTSHLHRTVLLCLVVVFILQILTEDPENCEIHTFARRRNLILDTYTRVLGLFF